MVKEENDGKKVKLNAQLLLLPPITRIVRRRWHEGHRNWRRSCCTIPLPKFEVGSRVDVPSSTTDAYLAVALAVLLIFGRKFIWLATFSR